MYAESADEKFDERKNAPVAVKPMVAVEEMREPRNRVSFLVPDPYQQKEASGRKIMSILESHSVNLHKQQRVAVNMFCCLTFFTMLAIVLNYYLTILSPQFNTDYKLKKEIQSLRSEVSALRHQTHNMEEIVVDIKTFLHRFEIESVAFEHAEQAAADRAAAEQALEKLAAAEKAKNEHKVEDEQIAYRYSVREVQTLQRLRLIDRNGNECTEPLAKHETVCKQIFGKN